MAGPHDGQPVMGRGLPPEQAQAALVLLHGRGADADDILALVPYLDTPGFAYVAPQAAGNTWYPDRFIAPLAHNEPWLSSALDLVGETLARLAAAGIPAEKTALLGFSQGACLALEYAARNARRWGAVIAFTGGLIGPDDTPRDYAGTLDGTPIFIGSSDTDPHVPLARVRQSTQVLTALGGSVTERIYPGMAHTVNDDELALAQAMLAALVAQP
jgi:predicted esterase